MGQILTRVAQLWRGSGLWLDKGAAPDTHSVRGCISTKLGARSETPAPPAAASHARALRAPRGHDTPTRKSTPRYAHRPRLWLGLRQPTGLDSARGSRGRSPPCVPTGHTRESMQQPQTHTVSGAASQPNLVPGARLELARLSTEVFETTASANSAIRAWSEQSNPITSPTDTKGGSQLTQLP